MLLRLALCKLPSLSIAPRFRRILHIHRIFGDLHIGLALPLTNAAARSGVRHDRRSEKWQGGRSRLGRLRDLAGRARDTCLATRTKRRLASSGGRDGCGTLGWGGAWGRRPDDCFDDAGGGGGCGGGGACAPPRGVRGVDVDAGKFGGRVEGRVVERRVEDDAVDLLALLVGLLADLVLAPLALGAVEGGHVCGVAWRGGGRGGREGQGVCGGDGDGECAVGGEGRVVGAGV